MAAVTEPRSKEAKKLIRQSLSTLFASLAFLVLVIAMTYFAWMVMAINSGGDELRARTYRQLGAYIGGELEWFRDAQVHVGSALLFALLSILLGRHPFARITLPVAVVLYVAVYFFDESILRVVREWASR